MRSPVEGGLEDDQQDEDGGSGADEDGGEGAEEDGHVHDDDAAVGLRHEVLGAVLVALAGEEVVAEGGPAVARGGSEEEVEDLRFFESEARGDGEGLVVG